MEKTFAFRGLSALTILQVNVSEWLYLLDQLLLWKNEIFQSVVLGVDSHSNWHTTVPNDEIY